MQTTVNRSNCSRSLAHGCKQAPPKPRSLARRHAAKVSNSQSSPHVELSEHGSWVSQSRRAAMLGVLATGAAMTLSLPRAAQADDFVTLPSGIKVRGVKVSYKGPKSRAHAVFCVACASGTWSTGPKQPGAQVGLRYSRQPALPAACCGGCGTALSALLAGAIAMRTNGGAFRCCTSLLLSM